MTTGVVTPLSLRAYAKSRKARGLAEPASLEGVRKAIASGRLQGAIVYVPGRMGRLDPKVANPELADRELEATKAVNQESRQAAAAVALAADQNARVLPPGPAPAPIVTDSAVSDERLAKVEAERAEYSRLRRETQSHELVKREAEAKMKALECAVREGGLVRTVEVREQLHELLDALRQRLDSLPTVVGRHIAFTLDVDQNEAITACAAALSDFRRDVARDFLRQSPNQSPAAA